jgi:hypothetical protein
VPSSADSGTKVFRGFEDRHVACRNLDRLSGLGIAGRAGLAAPHLEGAESPQFDAFAAPERLHHGGKEGVDHPPAVLLAGPRSDRLGDLSDEIGFGHRCLLVRWAL